MSAEGGQPIVFDIGSDMCRAGFACNKGPTTVIHPVVNQQKFFKTHHIEDAYVSDDEYLRSAARNFQQVIERGNIIEYDYLDMLLRYIYRVELKAEPEEHPVLLTETALLANINRQKLIDTLFSGFAVPSFYVDLQPVFSLFASNRTTGVVLESGHGTTQVVPIYEGQKIKHAIAKLNLSGTDVTLMMQTLLRECGYMLNTTREMGFVRDIKEKLCYVALDFDAEMEKAGKTKEIEKSYELPDGNLITINDERFRGPELLFKPYLDHKEFDGIDTLLYNSINKSKKYYQKYFYSNILLSGGTTLLNGFADRLKKEFKKFDGVPSKIDIITNQEHKHAAWVGGAKVASLPIFPQMSISKEEFEEEGSRILYRKCFT